MSANTQKIGPWEVDYNQTEKGGYWTVRRWNTKWSGYYEPMFRKDFSPIRFKTEEKAKQVAAEANSEASHD